VGFKLPPILKQVMTRCVGISDCTRECRTWVLLVCADKEIIVTDHSCSPVHRRNKLFSTCSEKSVLKESWMGTCKSGPRFLGRWTLWLRRRFPPSLPPCLPRAARWEVPVKHSCCGKSCSRRGGDVTSRRVRSHFTGSSESGWSPCAELGVQEGSDVGGSLCC